MELVALFLCDAANQTADGKINILGGGLTALGAPSYPANFHLSVVLRAEVGPQESGPHRIDIFLVDIDGKKLAGLEGGFTAPPQLKFANLILNLESFALPRPGRYEVRVHLDGKFRAAWPLEAVSIAPDQSGG